MGLILIILGISSIFFRSYYDLNGNLTHDSFHYLGMAKSITNGNIVSYKVTENDSLIFIRAWPLGYPVSIAIISFITNTSVFWASKFANAFFLFLIYLLIRHNNNRGNHLFDLSLLFIGELIIIYSFTWSESGFLAALFLLSHLTSKEKLPRTWALTLATISLFFFRYIGVYSILYFIIMLVIRKEKPILIKTLIITFSFILFYFLMLKYTSGHFLGVERTGYVQTRFELLWETTRSFISQFSFFSFRHIEGRFGFWLFIIGTMPFILLVYYFTNTLMFKWKKLTEKLKDDNRKFNFYHHLLINGISYFIVYFGVIIILNHPFGAASRFLLVGLIPILISINNLAIQINPGRLCNITQWTLTTFAFLSISYYGFIVPYNSKESYLNPNSNPELIRKEHQIYLKFN